MLDDYDDLRNKNYLNFVLFNFVVGVSAVFIYTALIEYMVISGVSMQNVLLPG